MLPLSARSAASASSSALRWLPSSRCACARLANSADASAASLQRAPMRYAPHANGK